MQNIKVGNINIIITEDYNEMSKEAAKIMADVVKTKENPILGLATGSTPEGLYKELIRMHKEEGLNFSTTTAFNLDEYYPLERENSQSYYTFMKENFFSHINIDMANTNIPNGAASDSTKECKEYDDKVRATGGVDIQVLGIGSNAHIAFNEPADVFEPITYKVALNKQTIEDNARFFDSIDDVPKEALTMGIGTIMSAKKIILLASGKNKAAAIKDMVTGKIDPKVPASILQVHTNITVIVDKEAATMLVENL